MSGLEWTLDQEQAFRVIDRWRKDGHPGQVCRVAGYAGVGKTTVAGVVANDSGAICATFTNKAARVMQAAGMKDACTLHSLLYRPKEVKNDKGKTELKFVPRERGDSGLADAKLLIVDEASMVGAGLGRDLLSHRIPVLMFADPFQLPPTDGGGSVFDAKKADAMLTQITRQAADSPIIQLATTLRTGGSIAAGRYAHGVKVIAQVEAVAADADGADQILVGMRATRRGRNALMRKRLGFEGPIPNIGERLVALKNAYDLGVLNGDGFIVKACAAPKDGMREWLLSLQPIGSDGTIVVPVDPLFDLESLDRDPVQGEYPLLGYGYAMTTHKAQGSQWGGVLVLDESRVFEKHERGMGARWLYTAITRAQRELTLVQRYKAPRAAGSRWTPRRTAPGARASA